MSGMRGKIIFLYPQRCRHSESKGVVCLVRTGFNFLFNLINNILHKIRNLKGSIAYTYFFGSAVAMCYYSYITSFKVEKFSVIACLLCLPYF